MNKRNIFSWALYDFANSFVFITFLLYFSKWIVVERGLSDWWYNATYIIGSLGLIIFAPFFGRRADINGKGRRYLTFSTIFCFVSYGLAVLSVAHGDGLLTPAVFFGLGNFFYQISFVFYNPLLNTLAGAHNRGRISGLGYLANYSGQILAILVSLPFVSGSFSLFGLNPLLAPLAISTSVFILLALPLLLCENIFEITPAKAQLGSLQTKPTIRLIVATPAILIFLSSFFLFSDAITTLINNFSIFMSSLFDISNSQVSIMVLIIIVFAAVGSWFFGWLSDRISARKTLLLILSIWAVVVPAIAATTFYPAFFGILIIAGLCVGGSWTVARQYLIEIAPSNVLNYVFGFFAISERAATIIGPLVWSGVVLIGGYRWAMFSLTAFLLAALLLILRMPKKSD